LLVLRVATSSLIAMATKCTCAISLGIHPPLGASSRTPQFIIR
jgi:hypothetical protein